MMFAPRGTQHSVKSVGPEIGRELIISSPGGVFDAFIAEASGALTAAAKGGPAADFRAIAAKYGIEFLSCLAPPVGSPYLFGRHRRILPAAPRIFQIRSP